MGIIRTDKYREGDYNVICDQTGQKAKRSNCRFTWDGLLVRNEVWEPKQPQLDIRGKEDVIAVPDSRPRQPDKFFVPTVDDL